MQSLPINTSHLEKLASQPLADLAIMLKAGIIRVDALQIISFPINSVHAYLYIYYLHQQHRSQQLAQFVHHVLLSQENQATETLLLLDSQIINSISNIKPLIVFNYRLEHKGKSVGSGCVVKEKNMFGLGNIVNVCIETVKNECQQLSVEQSIYLVRQILFPAYFCLGQAHKDILQALKRIIQQHYKQIIEELSQLFLVFYHQHWPNSTLDHNNATHVHQLYKQLTLLEIIHSKAPYPKQLLTSSLFRHHLKSLLLYKGQSKSSIHPLCIKVYQKIGSCLGELNEGALAFIKLFNILSCYGSHLIKDVWSSFYVLVDSQQKSFYQPFELIQVILNKLQNHQNSNVIKNCIHQLLKNEQSNRIFKRTPSIVYGSLIEMLNLGVHYLDCMFHMDSKMYSLIASFFLRFINSPQLSVAQMTKHLNWLAEAITRKSNFDHATIALLLVFKGQAKKTTFVTVEVLDSTKDLLVNAYNRFPIRKRFQLVDSILSLISNNINKEEVSIDFLLSYLVTINPEYLMAEKKQAIKKILLIYGEQQLKEWAHSMIDIIKESIRNNIEYVNASFKEEELYKSIKKVQFYHSICSIQPAYYEYYNQLIISFGQSQYKSIKQRAFIVNLYSIIQDNLLCQIDNTTQFTPHLEAVLNSIVFYVEADQEGQLNKQIIETIGCLCCRTYRYNEGEQFKEREGERVVLARMLQWANDKLHTCKLALTIIIAICRSRIQVLQQMRDKPNLYHHYEHLFEETLYDLYSQLEEEESKQTKIVMPKDKRLRLKTLLATILINDGFHRSSKNTLSCSDIGDIIDRYDFESYEETCWMTEAVYCNRNIGELQTQEANNISRQLELLLQNMVQNLEYSLSKKEIVSICRCTVTLLFRFAQANGSFSESLIQLALKLIKSGQSYLLFQRTVAFYVTQQLYNNFESICKLDCQHLIPLLTSILSIQQYRGFDSALYLYQQNMQDQLYAQFKMQLQANYQGAVPRFFLIYAFKKILARSSFTERSIIFLNSMIDASFEICMQVVVKQKMFLSGKNKLKLQMWQFLLVFTPSSLLLIARNNQFEKLLVRCVECIGHNLISQIRYYSEMFLMRIVSTVEFFSFISNEMLFALEDGLRRTIGNINRTISYIVVSGLLINHISRHVSHPHFESIRKSYISLYNCLLTYVGSSVAYFRGLSQYFCLSEVAACLQTKYVSILRQNFLLDRDARSLIERLGEIMKEYSQDIQGWEIEREVLRVVPNENYNVVCHHYYMDIFKRFSAELAKVNKNQDGFTAYRYIWKKHAGTHQEIQQQEEEAEAAQEDEEQIFQRKIDPTLDYLYGKQQTSKLKVMATSSKSQALIGHLARTGQIFGIDELIVPSLKIVESDQFKSISVTAQRWLKISDLGAKLGQSAKDQNVIRCLIKYKSEGFQIVKLSKKGEKGGESISLEMEQKCVLLVDEDGRMSGECLKLIDQQIMIGRHLSCHVQASIFIWSYFKKHLH